MVQSQKLSHVKSSFTFGDRSFPLLFSETDLVNCLATWVEDILDKILSGRLFKRFQICSRRIVVKESMDNED